MSGSANTKEAAASCVVLRAIGSLATKDAIGSFHAGINVLPFAVIALEKNIASNAVQTVSEQRSSI